MRKKLFLAVVLVVSLLILSSCSNNGMFVGLNQTSVELGKANYEIVASNVLGQSQAGYVLGFSAPLGAATNTFAVARVNGTGMLYKEALEDLWKNFEAEHGKIDGRKLALANLRYDSEALNLLVYTEVKVFIRADVIEFK
ncbi:MAG: hypothetical protein P8048_08135 [Calditrichia bacterium]